MINNRVNLIILLLLAIGGFAAPAATSEQIEMGNNGIQIYQNNLRYWQYKGKPVLLLGGSDDDNLFQWTGARLIEQLNLLKSVGGNYVRCTMSSRDEGNVWPFKQVKGKYNLEQWNEEYWQRFENFLKATCKRDIIVQVEIWATYDFYREPWQRHPFNPKNNMNYSAEQTGLSERFDHRPGYSENVFFQSVPAVRNQKTVLKYQRRFVDKMLSHSLKFGHVLYCMDNETAATPLWGKYWSEYVKTKAKEVGVDVQTTEMWYDHLDKNPPIPHATFDDPETYSFVDVSQNSHKRGQRHWDSLRLQLSRVDDRVRPLTNVKIYGADTGPERWFRADVDGVERFWRNIFGGMASARFHRPPAGLGLGKKAQANIRSLRMLTDNMDIFTCAARNDLLSGRKPNEAYCLASPGKEYAVYFPDDGEVKLDISPLKRPGTIRWLEISTSKWEKRQELKPAQSITLRPPRSGPWVVLLLRHGVATGMTAGDVTFTRTRLTTVAETNMGHVPMVDINGDGVIDIVAGLQWFEGPSWKRHPLYPPDPKPTAIDIGFTMPYDLDGDGDPDLMTHRRSSDDRNKNELFWFENPGPPSTDVWTKHHITWDTRWPEIIIFVDIDGDGRDEMICSDVCPGKGIRIYEIPQDPENASSWSWTTVDKSPLHGLGIGDLNEDERLDIISDFVWFEQDSRGGWIRHSLPSPGSARRGHETMQIKIYDVDADGDVDLILPRAHHYGAYWLESSGGEKPSFKLHEILPGKLPSQLHGVAYADIDGDGDLDIFAGKSRYRHGDPGNDEPLDVFWIELVRSSEPIRWVKHQLATDLTMGIGPTIADVDADGDMDLVLRGHGIGGRYVIGTRQTDVTLFIQNESVAATAELTAKSARSTTLHPPAEETALPYGKWNGATRVVYDNDQTLDVYTDEVLMAMASAGRIQLVGMITTRTVNGIGYDKYDELVTQRKQMVSLARKSGMMYLPDPVKGPRVSLQPPTSGKIEDTRTIGSEGSRLIVREARKASPGNPLIVICGGQLTAVADAWLLDPSIENKVVVAALLGGQKDMSGFNGLQDPWADYIVLQRLHYVQFPQSQAIPKVPKNWLRKNLPDTALRRWMLAKVHPLFPDKLPGDEDNDGQPVLPLLSDEYVIKVKRVAFGGWKNRRFGKGSVRFPSFASVPENGKSRALVVVRANGNVGTRAWQSAMSDPAAWNSEKGGGTVTSLPRRAALVVPVALAAPAGAADSPYPPGPRGGPVGPDVSLSEVEKGRFAKHITVEGRTAAAVQIACERAVKEGIRVVFLPAGQYVFDKEVRVPGGLTLLGEGAKTLCRAGDRSVHLFHVEGDGVRLTRLKLQGTDTAPSTDNNTYGISVSGKQNIRIDHCEVLGFSYALNFSSEATAQVDHCLIHHNLRDGLGYGVAIYSGAYVLVTDNEFSQNRHSLASNGALDWSSPKRLGKYIHKSAVRKTHWEFIRNRVGSNDQSPYELCAVDTHPGMDGTFVIENNIFENLRHGIGIRDGSGLIRHNVFRNLRTATKFRPLVAVSVSYGTHNNIPVEGCMPHNIEIGDNVFLIKEGIKYEKYSLGKAENITIDGKLVPKTKVERPALPIPQMQEMGEDGILRWREDHRQIAVRKYTNSPQFSRLSCTYELNSLIDSGRQE